MYEHIYLYDLKSEKPIYIHNNVKEITEEIQSTFEKLLKEAIEENTNSNINSENQMNLKNKSSKFYVLEGAYYTYSTADLFTSIFTIQKNNEKVYHDLLSEMTSDDNFFNFSDDSDKIKELLNFYLNKYFSKLNPQMDHKELIIKDENNNENQNGSLNKSKKVDAKAGKTIHVGEALETQIEELNKIELPKNYTKNKNLKLFLILIFLFVGIGLVIVLPFAI